MSGIVRAVFLISLLLMVSGGYFILAIKKPGMYPPKYILKKRAIALILLGGAFFLLGLMIQSFR